MPKKTKLILAIETSCDETAAAVLSYTPPFIPPLNKGGRRGGWPKIKTLSSIIKSQIRLHSKMGGVVPEAAARAHVKYIRPVVEKALKNSGLPPLSSPPKLGGERGGVDYIAVTVGPGLLPSLMVGVEFAKALSFATGIPLIPVNHLAGHLYSPFSSITPSPPLKIRGGRGEIFPMISLIVSGGHTILTLMNDIKDYKVLGMSLDDAAGEAFDKVAKMLGLPYPGGPVVERLALSLPKGRKPSINFPRPMINHKNYNFSFSGLKTAVLYYLRDNFQQATPTSLPPPRGRNKEGGMKTDICASFQQAIVDVLVAKTLRAAEEFNARSISLSGGVAANQALRQKLIVNCKLLDVKFFVPTKNLCTDNAEMIGIAAAFMLKNGFQPVAHNKVKANLNLSL